jgi:hypothetical protein
MFCEPPAFVAQFGLDTDLHVPDLVTTLMWDYGNVYSNNTRRLRVKLSDLDCQRVGVWFDSTILANDIAVPSGDYDDEHEAEIIDASVNWLKLFGVAWRDWSNDDFSLGNLSVVSPTFVDTKTNNLYMVLGTLNNDNELVKVVWPRPFGCEAIKAHLGNDFGPWCCIANAFKSYPDWYGGQLEVAKTLSDIPCYARSGVLSTAVRKGGFSAAIGAWNTFVASFNASLEEIDYTIVDYTGMTWIGVVSWTLPEGMRLVPRLVGMVQSLLQRSAALIQDFRLKRSNRVRFSSASETFIPGQWPAPVTGSFDATLNSVANGLNWLSGTSFFRLG